MKFLNRKGRRQRASDYSESGRRKYGVKIKKFVELSLVNLSEERRLD